MDSQYDAETNEEMNLMAKCQADYHLAREKYLMFCRRYGLNPFDLDILDRRLERLPRPDKVQIVRLILRLVRLERAMGNGLEIRPLFPLTIEQSDRTGYLVPAAVAGGTR